MVGNVGRLGGDDLVDVGFVDGASRNQVCGGAATGRVGATRLGVAARPAEILFSLLYQEFNIIITSWLHNSELFSSSTTHLHFTLGYSLRKCKVDYAKHSVTALTKELTFRYPAFV